jgi:hypothetical protein
MGNLARDERIRNDPDGVTAGGENGVGDKPHQSDAAATEDKTDPARRHLARKAFGRGAKLGHVPGTGSTEHTNTVERHRKDELSPRS